MSAGPGYSSSVVTFASREWSRAVPSIWVLVHERRARCGGRPRRRRTIEYVTGQGPGGGSELLVLDAEGNELRELYPFGEDWPGLYVATGDIDGDARAEIVAGAGTWSEPRVKVYGGSGSQKASFLAFDPGFQGGVRVASRRH